MRVFNGHSDLLTDLHYRRQAGETNVFDSYYAEDFLKGNVRGAIFVIWTDEAHQDDYKSWVNGMLETAMAEFEESQYLQQVRSMEEYDKAIEDGKIAVFLGMEGLAAVAEDPKRYEELVKVYGVRHSGLTWNEKNPLASGVPEEGGLTDAGKERVKLIEKLGVVLDVSHLNDDSFWDLIRTAEGPVVATHSNARALASHRRNLKDDMMLAIKETGGLIGLNAATDFISDDEDKQDLAHLVKMLEYMVGVVGIDHVAFGFDFMDFLPLEAQGSMKPPEGKTATPRDFLRESDLPNLLDEMERVGFTEEEIEKIAHRNWEDLLRKVIG